MNNGVRDNSIDLLKGIGMLSVIIGHTTHIWMLRGLVCTYHMPIFFFTSGYFYKYRPTKQLFRSLFKALIIPYLVICILRVVLKLCFMKEEYHFDLISFVRELVFADGYFNYTIIWGEQPIIGVPWFLPALFWGRIIYNWIGESKYHVMLSIIISALSYILGYYIINIPFGVLEGGQAVIFYMSGRLIKEYQAVLNDKRYLSIMLIFWGWHYYVGGFSMADFSYGFYPINVIGAICACCLLMKFGRFVCKECTNRVVTFLEWCGLYSLTLFGMHVFFLPLCPFSKWVHVMIAHLIVCPILSWGYIKFKTSVICLKR